MKTLLNLFKRNEFKKSLEREPLYLEMLASGIGTEPITLINIGSSDGAECFYAFNLKNKQITAHIVEPDLKNLMACEKNLARLKKANISFHNIGISDKNKTDSFFINPEASNLNSATPTSTANKAVTIDYMTLTSFIERQAITTPLLLNMDIEGHEVEVLEGFYEFARVHSRIKILMEVHPSLYTQNHSLEAMLKKYFDCGFKPTFIESAGVIRPSMFADYGLAPIKTAKNRGLYTNINEAFVLEAACHEHLIAIDTAGRTSRKIVRSLMIEKS